MYIEQYTTHIPDNKNSGHGYLAPRHCVVVFKDFSTGLNEEKVQITEKTNRWYHPSTCVILLFSLA